jgi:signal transduction histidine kinase
VTATIRETCADLRPASLDYAGLTHALQAYAEIWSRRTGIPIDLSCSEPDTRRTADVELVLFRIAQEALVNCAKHAKASAVKVELRYARAKTYLTISDNGVGFDAMSLDNFGRVAGLGLITMRERAEFAGGRLSVITKPGKGTKITVVV